jgi:hypothetical protein
MASRYEHPIRVTDERIAYITKYQEEHKLSSRPEALDVILGKAIDAPPSPVPTSSAPRTDGGGLTIPDELKERVMSTPRWQGLDPQKAIEEAIKWGCNRVAQLDGWAGKNKEKKEKIRESRPVKEKKTTVKEEPTTEVEPTATEKAPAETEG